MSEAGHRGELGRRASRLAPLLLVLGLAAAWLAPGLPGVALPDDAGAERPAAADFSSALDALPGRPTVLVAMDPDLGTYAEIRPTVRSVLADLLRRDGRLVLVSLTPEGRALAVAERQRLSRLETNPTRTLDLGFVPGAEAGLVDLVRDPPVPSGATGALARAVADDGFRAFDAVLVVGGNDLGPRSWIEQVRPRLEDPPPFLAVAPSVLLPEIAPYLADGALAAALATAPDGAAYRARIELDSLDRLVAGDDVPATPLLLGLLAAIAALAMTWVGRATRLGTSEGRT